MGFDYFENFSKPEKRNLIETSLSNLDFKKYYNVLQTLRKEKLKKLSGNAGKLYFYFTTFINMKQYVFFCYPAWKTIIKEMGISNHGLVNALNELKEENWIRVYKCGETTFKNSKNVYFLMEFIREEQLENYLYVIKHIFNIPNFKTE